MAHSQEGHAAPLRDALEIFGRAIDLLVSAYQQQSQSRFLSGFRGKPAINPLLDLRGEVAAT